MSKYNSQYPCTGCGQCCRMIGIVLSIRDTMEPTDQFYEEYMAFPYSASNGGACEQLQADNSCGVYDKRPDLCNSTIMYNRHFAKEETKLEHDLKAATACNELVQIGGLPDKYLVKIET